MLFTSSIVYLSMILARKYSSDLGVDHLTMVKIILRRLGYGGNKEFVVKSYADASFYTDQDDSESQSGYILKVGAIS